MQITSHKVTLTLKLSSHKVIIDLRAKKPFELEIGHRYYEKTILIDQEIVLITIGMHILIIFYWHLFFLKKKKFNKEIKFYWSKF